ncbi:ATP-binding cassette domain-containing protein, partial [Leucobacter sp. M11]|uniref:ATP-binding cassette domain-containing protein n=1 Tax=Leucobacter sp. M11 TaxID=2993565 RepID=UPI002D7FBAD5
MLAVSGLQVRFPVKTKTGTEWVQAVQDASFSVRRGETLGLVGESGSGKSTIANALTGQVDPVAGTVLLNDEDVL